ncbi:MAG: MFS transporter [Candidatus Nanopelagicales bacterium]
MTGWTLERSLRFLPWAVFIATFDRSVITPMLVGMAADFDVSLATITLAASVYYTGYGLAQPVWGLVSDRIGRTATLRLALVLAAALDLVSVIPMAVGPFIAVRGVAGAMMAGVFPAALIFIGDTVRESARRQPAVVGLQSGVAMGLTLGTVLGGVGIATVGWQAFFVTTAVVSLALAWWSRGMPNPRPGADRVPALASFRMVLSSHWPWLLYGLVFVEAGVLLGTLALIPAALETDGSSASLAGLMTGGYGLAVLLTSLVVRRTSPHWPAHVLLLVGGISAALGFALLAVHVSPVLVLVSVALQGVAWVFMHTTLQTWATTLSERARATAVSLFACSMFLGNGAGASAAGVVLQNDGPTVLFGGATVLTLALTAVAVLSRRRYADRLA